MYQKNVIVHGRSMMLTIKPTFEVRVDGYSIIGRGQSESEAITDFSRQLSMLPPFQKEYPSPPGGRVINVGVTQKLGTDDEVS